MQQSTRFALFFSILIISSVTITSATPIIILNSPQNITYNSTQVLLNATANEPVDFYFKNVRTGNTMILAKNVSSINSLLYFGKGTHQITIWANDSTGEVNKTIYFNSTVHNPVNITSCGIIGSSDTKYIVRSDLYPNSSILWGMYCLYAYEVRNITLDLNGYTVNTGTTNGIDLGYGSDMELFNGTVKGSPSWTQYGITPRMLELEGTRLNIHDLNLSGFMGADIWSLGESLFNRVHVNASVGFWFEGPVTNTYFVNSTIVWNGQNIQHNFWSGTPVAFFDQSDHSNIYFENVYANTTFPKYDFSFQGSFTDIYLRNTDINMSNIDYPDWLADTRIFTQHLIVINVTDQLNQTGSGIIDIEDNGLFGHNESAEDESAESTPNTNILENPTDDLLVPINSKGQGSTWLTEKLTYAKSDSPATIYTYNFSNYTLTARSWDTNETIQLNLTGHHSTIPVSFKLDIPGALPACTVPEMLDLNNDGEIDMADATIVLRYITGLPVSINDTKNCTGINLSPF